eukprot:1162090-Pelagomonas_calceolata.AAC.14
MVLDGEGVLHCQGAHTVQRWEGGDSCVVWGLQDGQGGSAACACACDGGGAAAGLDACGAHAPRRVWANKTAVNVAATAAAAAA